VGLLALKSVELALVEDLEIEPVLFHRSTCPRSATGYLECPGVVLLGVEAQGSVLSDESADQALKLVWRGHESFFLALPCFADR